MEDVLAAVPRLPCKHADRGFEYGSFRNSPPSDVGGEGGQEGYDYPPIVRFEVQAGNPRDYPRAADYLNMSDVDLVCVQ